MATLRAILVAMLVVFSCPVAHAEVGEAILIDTASLFRRMAEPGVVIVDAESATDFARARIPGAVNLYYMDLEDSEENAKSGRPIFPQLAATKLGDLGIGNQSEIFVYDSGNGRAASAV